MKKIFIIFFFLLLACSANAITYTVTNCASSAATEGSLPWAISQANLQLDTVEVDFNVPTSEVGFITTEAGGSFWRIILSDTLRLSHNGTVVLGSTQSSFEGDTNPNGPEIEITGNGVTPLESLIKLLANDCAVEGLAINNSTGYGIAITSCNRNRLYKDYIGTTPSGEAAKPNILGGISLEAADRNTIEACLIAGNKHNGINMFVNTHCFIVNNAISSNEMNGIFLDGDVTKFNNFSRNIMYANGGKGINLLNGANQNIHVPIILTAEAYPLSENTFVSGTSEPFAHIEIFRVETPEVESAGEGQYFLISTEADSSGEWSTYIMSNEAGNKLTATQTDLSSDTSEFSLNHGPILQTVERRPDSEIALLSNGSDYVGANIINSSGDNQSKSSAVLAGQKSIFYIRSTNFGTTNEPLVITGTPGDPSLEVSYFDSKTAGNDITALVTKEGWVTSDLLTGEGVEYRVETRALVSDAMSKDVYISVASSHVSYKKDVVLATAVTTLPAQALDHFTGFAQPSIEATRPFILTIEARDVSGKITTEVRGVSHLSVDLGLISPESIDAVNFVDEGVWSGVATVSRAGSRIITVTNGTAKGEIPIVVNNTTTEFSNAALGVTVIIPPGAATDEVPIDISDISSLPIDAPKNTWQAGRIISLISNIKNFLKPITITMPLFAGTKSPEIFFLDGSTWSDAGLIIISQNTSSITFSSTHLTTFVPFSQAQTIQYTFGPNPFNPIKDGNGYFWYWLTSVKNTQLYLFDLTGSLVYKRDFLIGSNGARGGANIVSWDGKNSFGELVANGVYIYQIVQEGKAISRGKVVVLRR